MDITELQQRLHALGLLGSVDGIFGPQTAAAMNAALDQLAASVTPDLPAPTPPPSASGPVLRMSTAGLQHLIEREGSRTHAYQDSVGVWTIGVGHTAAAGEPHPSAGMVITDAYVMELLRKDIGQYEDAVRKAVHVPLAQHEFDALVSLCFNIGTGHFRESTVVERLNAGDHGQRIADAILMWGKPPEIMGRRRGEARQFLNGN